jgi:gas vesicle protein
MASASVKQSCVRCDKGFGRNMCGGCQQWFCKTQYNEHQEALAKEMDNITEKHDELHSHLTTNHMDSENPLLVRVNKWEQRSIDRIRAVANEARTDLKQSLGQIRKQIKTSLSQVADQLKSSRENEDYTEIDLKCWMDQLESLKKRLLNPSEIELCGDAQSETNASNIRFIELKAPRMLSKLMQILPIALHHEKAFFKKLSLLFPVNSSVDRSR